MFRKQVQSIDALRNKAKVPICGLVSTSMQAGKTTILEMLSSQKAPILPVECPYLCPDGSGEYYFNDDVVKYLCSDVFAYVLVCDDSLIPKNVLSGLDDLEFEFRGIDQEIIELFERQIQDSMTTRECDSKTDAILRMLSDLRTHLGHRRQASSFLVDEYAGEYSAVRKVFQGLYLTSAKPFFYICNIVESSGSEQSVAEVRLFAKEKGIDVVVLCRPLEMELSKLNLADQEEFRKSFGLDPAPVDRIVQVCRKLISPEQIDARLQTYSVFSSASSDFYG